jgi:hypothetical protein
MYRSPLLLATSQGGAVAFDGTGDYLTVGSDSDLAIGTGAFTIEFFFNPDTTATATLYDARPAATNGAYITISYIGGALILTMNGTDAITAGAPALDTWHHLAVCRSGTSTRMFLNGVQLGSTIVDATSYLQATNRPVVGASGFALGATSFDGMISNLRVTKGLALYTADFTPPAGDLQSLPEAELLTARGTAIIDESHNAYTITAAGNAAISAAGPF